MEDAFALDDCRQSALQPPGICRTTPRSAYDGSWDLVFVTQSGSCDPSYNFTVNVSDGIVTHPNLVKFKGYVAKSGSVHASVTVHDKFASGHGQAFSEPRVAEVGGGPTRREVGDALAIGLPRNAIDQFEKAKHRAPSR